MRIKLCALAALMSFYFNSQSQNTRLSLELGGGIPVPLVSISGTLTTYGSVGLRYNLLKEISVQGLVHIGTLAGQQTPGTLTSPDNISNYSGFTTNFVQYSLNGQLDLGRTFGMRSFFKRINPFLIAGGGMMQSNVVAKRPGTTDKTYKVNFYTGYGGLEFRYYLNPSLDLCLSSLFTFTQSPYVDGLFFDNKNDMYLLNGVGINYKFGAKSQKQHIEWNNVILKERIYLPNIEKRNGQPIDEDGNYVVYSKDSISKMIALNQQLKEENAKQKQELEAVKKEVSTLKGETETLKVQMDTLSKSVKKLEEQNRQINDRLNSQPPVQPSQPAPPAGQPKVITAPKNTYVPNEPVVAPETPVTPAPKTPPVKTEPRAQPPVVPSPTPAKEKKQTAINPVEPVEQPTKEPKELPVAEPGTALNAIDGITAPVERYNVVAGAYAGPKYAYIFRDKVRSKGYDAAIFKSDVDSKILRVCVFTTSNKEEAIRMMNKVRKELDPKAWIHVYTEK